MKYSIRYVIGKFPWTRHVLNLAFTYLRTIFLEKIIVIDILNGINWNKAKEHTILVAGTVSTNSDSIIEHVIAKSYSRNNKVYNLKCDGILEACFICKKYLWDSNRLEKRLANNGPGTSCIVCQHRSENLSRIFQTEAILFSEHINQIEQQQIKHFTESIDSIESIKKFKLNGINIGKHAYAGAVRFYASPFLEREENGFTICLSFLKAALKTYFVSLRVLKEFNITLVIVNHGIYVPQGIIAEVANMMGINTLCFATGYRNKTYMVSKNKSYHFDILNRKNFEKELIGYSREKIDQYLRSRSSGKNDWILFHEENSKLEDLSEIVKSNKNNIILFTNVLWDGDVHFDESYFANMLEWLQKTVRALINNEENNLIIRIHPGEEKGFIKSRALLKTELHKIFTKKEINSLKIINSDSKINSYTLAESCNHIIVYGSKLAIELAGMGYKILTGGPSWTINKGITVDPKNLNEYLDHLIDIDKNIFHSKYKVDFEKAKKFAFYVFFNRCLPIHMIDRREGDPPFKLIKEKESLIKNDFHVIQDYIEK